VAVDGSKLDVPDSPAHARAFGCPGVAKGSAPWPQVLVVGLGECASHALLAVGVWPVQSNEHAAAHRLLRRVPAGHLLLYDAGLHSVDLVAQVRQRGAQVLGGLPGHVRPQVLYPLPDGSALGTLRPSSRSGTSVPGPMRLIRSTIDDPPRPGSRQEHRLLTSLLDPVQSPAEELILLYHQRWEFEVGLDELVVHQRPRRPLRSQRPLGVIQERSALFLLPYLLRALMVEAVATVELPPTRLSFLETLRIVRLAVSDFPRYAPACHERLAQALLTDIAACVLPERRERLNPRVVKRAQSTFRVQRPADRPSPKPTKSFPEAIVLLN
jgi:Transposase DDE domain